MNLRSLCFVEAARGAGEAWRWWEFAHRLGAQCRMAAGNFTSACAEQVGGAGWADFGPGVAAVVRLQWGPRPPRGARHTQ